MKQIQFVGLLALVVFIFSGCTYSADVEEEYVAMPTEDSSEEMPLEKSDSEDKGVDTDMDDDTLVEEDASDMKKEVTVHKTDSFTSLEEYASLVTAEAAVSDQYALETVPEGYVLMTVGGNNPLNLGKMVDSSDTTILIYGESSLKDGSGSLGEEYLFYLEVHEAGEGKTYFGLFKDELLALMQ